MTQNPSQQRHVEPPAMGERRARWGYGYQDKVATERTLNILREDLRQGKAAFKGIRLADLEAGRVDDFVLVWGTAVEGHSIKWSGEASPMNWGDLAGANGILKELSDGHSHLLKRWPDKVVSVRLQSNRPPSTEKHHSQLISTFSVAEFLRDHWQAGPTMQDLPEIAEIWTILAEHTGLAGSALSEFVKSCSFTLGHPQPPGPVVDTHDWRHYRKQFEDLYRALATWVADRPSEDFVDRRFLLSAIGHRVNEAVLIQKFPPSQIPYEKNGTSSEQIRQLIKETAGGYIAVTGPAGIGKSTLVQDVLANADNPYFIPYYAFLPDGEGNPRDRGEALTFFQDVIGRLDKFYGHRYSLGITDVGQGRDALRQHMATANEQYLIHGHKTILLIDGLDHVLREVGLQNSILHELPRPSEIPTGFVVILSSQPQALTSDTIGADVAYAVSRQSGQRVVVGGLGRPETHTIIGKVDRPTTGTDRDALYDACQGNPLILTFLIKQWRLTPATTINDAIELAGNYTGDIEKYYQTHLAVPLQDAETRYLLALLCRAAPTIPVSWLQSWSERSAIENLYERIIVAYVRVEDGSLYFTHNSLIAFLKSETRSKIPGADPVVDEQHFHSILADRCGDCACIEPLGRARILHLQRAGKLRDLLRILSSEWLRQAISGFLPYALVRPLLLLGIDAGWSLKEYGHVVRLILLDFELDQRTARTEAGDLAEIFLKLDRPGLAISQIRTAGRLLVDDQVALGFARHLWHFAKENANPSLDNVARGLYEQAKPVSFFYQNEPLDTSRHHDNFSILQAWAEAAPLFEAPVSIVTQIQKLNFTAGERREEVNADDVKAGLLYEAIITSMEAGSGIDGVLLGAITELSRPNFLFGALVQLGRSNSSEASFDILRSTFAKCERNDDLDLAYAKLLNRRGCKEEAKHIVSRLVHKRIDGVRNNHSFGFSDVSYTVALRSLQEVLEIPEGPVPSAKDDYEEAFARIETTSRHLGILLITAHSGRSIPNLQNVFRSLLLFHNQTVTFPEFNWRNKYVIAQSKMDIYRQIVRLAITIGNQGLEALRDALLQLLSSPASTQYYANHRRYFAKALYHKGVLSKDQAIEIGLSSTLDASDDDPNQRQKACFEIAEFLHSVDDAQHAVEWVTRASEVSVGAGSHKDYHMVDLANWVSRSMGEAFDSNKLGVLERFSRVVGVAGGDGSDRAAGELIQLVLSIDPLRAAALSVELIDRGVLNVSQTLQALIIGGGKSGASPGLLLAFYCELMSLIDPGDTSDAAKSVVRSFQQTGRVAAAQSLMVSVRTNSLPSHRIEVGRALQDALRTDGLGDHCFTKGLIRARNDSSRKNSLYIISANRTLTTNEVSARLSKADQMHHWNPNPADNTEFDWWSAIRKAEIKSLDHLNALISNFPPPEYRAVELLAWKSKYFLEAGDRNSARQLAEQAIECGANGSWFKRYDGAQKIAAYAALKRIDSDTSLRQARDRFGKDLSTGKLGHPYLLSEILNVFDFLEIEWPEGDSLRAIDEYLIGVLKANQAVPLYDSLTQKAKIGSVDQAISMFLLRLLSFPVVDVCVAARRTLEVYLRTDGRGVVSLLNSESCWDEVQLEYLLACLHVGSRSNPKSIQALQDWLVNLNRNESVAVRGIARRICDERGWPWQQISNLPTQESGIILTESLRNPGSYQEAHMLVNGDSAIALELFRGVLRMLEEAGHNSEELRSSFHRFYDRVEKGYVWANDKRLELWVKRVLAERWLAPRAIIGREAAMRLLGVRSLSDESLAGSEQTYDFLYPIYDPALELYRPDERPAELAAMDWDFLGEGGKGWLNGQKAGNWTDYPESVGGLHILGERTWYIRPDWEWPREERYRGVLNNVMDAQLPRQRFASGRELTYASYLRGLGQEDDQLLVWNFEQQLIGPTYRWVAINSNVARGLGWMPAQSDPFTWIDRTGAMMVQSMFWRDGWIWLEPPRFEALGEGWIVLATPSAVKAIREKYPVAVQHLWVERHSGGDRKYTGTWHLQRALS